MGNVLLLGELKALGVPMRNILLLPRLKARGVCGCRRYCVWQNQRPWVCAHAECIIFGEMEGIGCVPMLNLLLLAELKLLGVCPWKINYFRQI